MSDITKPTCFEDFGQVVGGAFQRVFSSGTTKNKFTYSSGNPNLLASWQAFTTGVTDGTKIVPIPQFANVETEAGEVREFGSGNQVAGGVPYLKGNENSSLTGTFWGTPQSVIKQIKQMQCEVGPSGGALGVYFFNEDGQILGISDDNSIGGTPAELYPIPLSYFNCKDLKLGGRDGVNQNDFKMMMPPNWSDNTIVVSTVAGFNILTDL